GRVAELLGPRVLEVRRLNLADGRPFALVTVWCREDLAGPISKAAVEQASFYELLAERPLAASQTIVAALPDPADAEVLDVSPASPVLVVRRTTTAADGSVMLLAEQVFPAHLTEFTAQLGPVDSETVAPPGLRLIDD
ncbi:MAG: GntR family transcriptional regulator, partial [Acidimicrobiales bacterium]